MDAVKSGMGKREISATLWLAKMSWGKGAGWGFLGTWLFITLFPIYWIIRMAFSTQRLLLANPTTERVAQYVADTLPRRGSGQPEQRGERPGRSPRQRGLDHADKPALDRWRAPKGSGLEIQRPLDKPGHRRAPARADLVERLAVWLGEPVGFPARSRSDPCLVLRELR